MITLVGGTTVASDSVWDARSYGIEDRWYVKVLVPGKDVGDGRWKLVSGVSFDSLYDAEKYIRETFRGIVERRS